MGVPKTIVNVRMSVISSTPLGKLDAYLGVPYLESWASDSLEQISGISAPLSGRMNDLFWSILRVNNEDNEDKLVIPAVAVKKEDSTRVELDVSSVKPNDNHSTTEIFDGTSEVELVEVLDDAEVSEVVVQFEDSQRRDINKAKVATIVDIVVNKAYEAMYPGNIDDEAKCDECDKRSEVIEHKDKMLDDKEFKLEVKSATINGLLQNLRRAAIDKAMYIKKYKEVERYRKMLNENQKKLSNLKIELVTKKVSPRR